MHAAALVLLGRGVVFHDPSLATRSLHVADAALAGDTLDVEAPPLERVDEAAPPRSMDDPGATAMASPQRSRSTAQALGGRGHAQLGSGEALGAPLFGAVGVRYAADLATAFAHAFPQAASADALWLEAPFGSAGTLDLELTLDEGGHIVESDFAGTPTVALRRGVERTLALLVPRVFTAGGVQTRLRVRAQVTRDDVHDGLHGDVFALSGGSFVGRTGTAFFALPPGTGPGRRVDVEFALMP